MTSRNWAPGGKLTAAEVDAVRRGDDEAAEGKVCPRQVERIRAGDSWPQGWRPPQVDSGERRECPMCGVVFGRRFPSGRSRSDSLWAQKRTCSNSCCIKMRWVAGGYAGRRPKKP